MPIVISFSGTHSTGKTTAFHEAAAALKRMYPNLRIGAVNELAERCPLKTLSARNSSINLDGQRWMFSAQICAELEAIDRYDISVTDRTVVDMIAYTIVGGFAPVARGMLEMVETHIGVYDRIFFMRASPRLKVVADGFRDTNEVLRLKVEKVLLGLYRKLGCKLDIWRGEESLKDMFRKPVFQETNFSMLPQIKAG
jgi:hypothetical protein